ncbi:MAG: radical SAM family heme chaperone HemW [Deltaproteobacteria bacterium]|nr:radical SAM family heme chaperone HemW [Deltaproteobacteria bacterium]
MDRAGLYIHVPFCKTRCPYCDFFSTTRRSLIPRWIEALLQEASQYEGLFPSFDSLYLGGGTPSLLSPRQLEKLVRAMDSRFPFAADTEKTIEINPDDVTREMIEALRALGFNRISLGIQSLDEADLRFLARRHSVRDCLGSLDLVRDQGFDNLSVDLMYGLITQTPKEWLGTLQRILDFRPEHISCYQLTVKPGTPFHRLWTEGRLAPLPEETQSEFYTLTCSFLEGLGYGHYEVSNFSRSETLRSRHNSKYWHHAPYLGLGPSAHSFDGRFRWWNVRSVRAYCHALDQGRPAVAGREALSEEQLLMERLLLGFRTRDGVPLGLVAGCDHADRIVSELEGAGLITLQGGNLLPTQAGFLVADSLPLLFLGV